MPEDTIQSYNCPPGFRYSHVASLIWAESGIQTVAYVHLDQSPESFALTTETNCNPQPDAMARV